MSVPRRHHYLPQFFLSGWVNEIGSLFEYSRPYREVVVRERRPSETGYREGLYSIADRADPVSREEVELRFMQRLDDAAAIAMPELEAILGKPADASLVSDWACFVMSLVFRSPARIDEMRGEIAKIDSDPRIDLAYQATKLPDDPASYAEFAAINGDEFSYEEARANLLRRVVASDFSVERLSSMLWDVVSVRPDGHDLVLSDNPVVTSNGVLSHDGFLILPIGPRKFFLASSSPSVRRYFKQEAMQRRFAGALNHAIVHNAEELVLAQTRHHRAFVSKRLTAKGQPLRERVTWQI